MKEYNFGPFRVKATREVGKMDVLVHISKMETFRKLITEQKKEAAVEISKEMFEALEKELKEIKEERDLLKEILDADEVPTEEE